MAKELVTDELWEIVEPLLPPEPPKPRGGRPRVPNRAVLTGIVFVLKTGIPWEMLRYLYRSVDTNFGESTFQALG